MLLLRKDNLVGFWKVLNKGKYQNNKNDFKNKNYQINYYINE